MTLNALIEQLRTALERMKSSERPEVFERITAGYCKHCGTEHLPCYCERDE